MVDQIGKNAVPRHSGATMGSVNESAISLYTELAQAWDIYVETNF